MIISSTFNKKCCYSCSELASTTYKESPETLGGATGRQEVVTACTRLANETLLSHIPDVKHEEKKHDRLVVTEESHAELETVWKRSDKETRAYNGVDVVGCKNQPNIQMQPINITNICSRLKRCHGNEIADHCEIFPNCSVIDNDASCAVVTEIKKEYDKSEIFQDCNVVDNNASCGALTEIKKESDSETASSCIDQGLTKSAKITQADSHSHVIPPGNTDIDSLTTKGQNGSKTVETGLFGVERVPGILTKQCYLGMNISGISMVEKYREVKKRGCGRPKKPQHSCNEKVRSENSRQSHKPIKQQEGLYKDPCQGLGNIIGDTSQQSDTPTEQEDLFKDPCQGLGSNLRNTSQQSDTLVKHQEGLYKDPCQELVNSIGNTRQQYDKSTKQEGLYTDQCQGLRNSIGNTSQQSDTLIKQEDLFKDLCHGLGNSIGNTSQQNNTLAKHQEGLYKNPCQELGNSIGNTSQQNDKSSKQEGLYKDRCQGLGNSIGSTSPQCDTPIKQEGLYKDQCQGLGNSIGNTSPQCDTPIKPEDLYKDPCQGLGNSIGNTNPQCDTPIKCFRRTSNPLQYICSYCGKLFNATTPLRTHINVHHNPNATVYACDKCQYKTKDPQNYKKHLRHQHQPVKMFICDRCGYAAKQATSLRLHSKTVHEENAFHCTYEGCGKSFSKKGNLKVHMCSHTGEKRLTCLHCEYQCIQQAALQWHMKRKHPGIPYLYTKKYAHTVTKANKEDG